MKKTFAVKLSVLSFAIAATSFSQTSVADSFYEALSTGKAKLDARLRYEGVSDDNNAAKDAKGLTLRTRLGYQTAALFDTTAYVEMEDVRVLGGIDEYAPESAGYSTIADPRSTELNQAYLSYKPMQGLEVKPGRQRLILDNARFVGNVGWRQNEQTFDALTVNYQHAGFAVTASYIGQVNGIIDKFDASDADDILLNVSYNFTDVGKLSAYHYVLDHEAEVNLDLTTSGLRFSGKSGESIPLHYSLEYARQENDLNNKSADYLFAEFGMSFKPVNLFVGYELLGSDGGDYGFQTPLATKHAFNGWADMFLVTPNAGLEDLYIKAAAKAAGMNFAVIYHDYSADDSGDSLGSEVNLLAVKGFAKKYKVGLKYAAYSAANNSTYVDTDKVWLWGEMAF